MQSIMRGGALLAAALALVASASGPKRHKFENSSVTAASYDATWSAVIEVFASHNWPIQNMEKDSGLITTDWMSLDGYEHGADCGSAPLASKNGRGVRFNVLVREADGGARVTVNTTMREARSFDGNHFMVDCQSTGALEAAVHGMVDSTVATSARADRKRAEERARAAAKAVTTPAAGADGGACYGNGTCNAGLACDAAARCVQPKLEQRPDDE